MGLAVLARNVRRTAELGLVAAEQRETRIAEAGGIEHPEEDASGCKLSARTGWPWILQFDSRFWLHRVDSAAYNHEISAAMLNASVRRDLDNQVRFDGRKDLEVSYIRPLADVCPEYMRRVNVYEPATNVLRSSALKWMPSDRAKFHGHIDRWLRALAGPEAYPQLAQWLASCMDLTRPAPCLYITGNLELGKTLLANGLASLWGVRAPGKMREVVSNFNQCLATCPLVFGDEGLPETISFDWFRESITSYCQRVNMKNLRQFDLPAAPDTWWRPTTWRASAT
jgi:hypothetical protein